MAYPSVILPGYLAGSSDYIPFTQELQKRGFNSVVVPLQWWEWLPTVGGRSVVPILNRLDQTVQQVLQQFNTDKVNIIAHSAGGWLARIYLGDQPYYDRAWQAHHWVSQLVTLGTPHQSREPWTKKNLNFVNDQYPGAFYDHVRYVCVAGRAVEGKDTWLATQSYKLTIGDGSAWGDGITPIAAAHLTGAVNLTLEGANHSPKQTPWYGSADLLDRWVEKLNF